MVMKNILLALILISTIGLGCKKNEIVQKITVKIALGAPEGTIINLTIVKGNVIDPVFITNTEDIVLDELISTKTYSKEISIHGVKEISVFLHYKDKNIQQTLTLEIYQNGNKLLPNGAGSSYTLSN